MEGQEVRNSKSDHQRDCPNDQRVVERLQIQRQRDRRGQHIDVVHEVERGYRVETIELKKTVGNDHQQRDAEKQQQHQQQRTDLQVGRQGWRNFHDQMTENKSKK